MTSFESVAPVRHAVSLPMRRVARAGIVTF